MSENDYSPLTNEEIEQAFEHGTTSELSQTLVTLALYGSDWRRVEKYCLEFLEHSDPGVRRVAATCLGHLARIHKMLDLDLVLPALYKHFADSDKYVAGAADDALGDIEIFMQIPVDRLPSDPNEDEDENTAIELDDDEILEEIRDLTPEKIEGILQSHDVLEIEKLLVKLAYHDADWQKAERYCLQCIDHANANVRGVVVDCLHHLAYKYQTLDFDEVLPALYRHRFDTNQAVANKVADILDYIEKKLHIPVQLVNQESVTTSVQSPRQEQRQEQGIAPKVFDRTAVYTIANLTFLADPLAYQPGQDEICLHVPPTIASPRELIDLLTTRLDLPPTEDGSWIALSEVLSTWDEWRITPRRVVLLHNEMPFAQSDETGWRQPKLYLTVLLRSIVKVREKNATRLPFEGSRELVAIFPERLKDECAALLARSAASAPIK